MLVLGIETTCDETAAAVVERDGEARGRILSNVILSQTAEHEVFGGVVPEIAARAHVETLDHVVAKALNDAEVSLARIDGIAAAAGPGLIGGVIVGLTTAKAMALVADKPLIAVNHLEAHALTARLTDGTPFPYCLFLASGGHTQVVAVRGVGDYVRLGTTMDDAIGEAFDKTAKLLGLGYPGGPALSELAERGTPGRYKLPRPMINSDDLDFSFSGLKTAVLGHAKAADAAVYPDIARAFVEAVVDVLVAKCVRALETTGLTKLVVAGGVGANKQLRAALNAEASARGFEVFYPEPELCTDNGAMIAFAAALRLTAESSEKSSFSVKPRWDLEA